MALLSTEGRHQGPPKAPGIEAQDCSRGTGFSLATMFRGIGREHPYFGVCVCRDCHRKLQYRELAMLDEMHNKGKLTNVQLQERLKLLKKRVVEHRERHYARRDNEDKQVEKWVKDWNKQNTQSAEIDENRQKKLKHQRSAAAEQRANGKKK
jgi:hypothetical protein